jgi:hypothetical protein
MIEWLALGLMQEEIEEQDERIQQLEYDILDLKLAMLYMAKIELKRRVKEMMKREEE